MDGHGGNGELLESAGPVELEQLIAEQADDMERGDRVWSVSLDAFPSVDVAEHRPRLRASDERHGTLFGYVRLRCRCSRCCQASREYEQRRYWSDPEKHRARKRAKRPA